MTQHFPDQNLVERLAAGDGDAFIIMYDRYYSWLRFTAEDLVEDSSESQDIVQEFLIDFWEKKWYTRIRNIPGKSEDRILKDYLFTCIHNRCLNYLTRKKKQLLPLNEGMLSHPSQAPNYIVENKQLEKQLKEAVEKLPKQTARVFSMTYEDGESRKAVAEKLEISEHTVKNLLLKGVKLMRAQLKYLYPSNSTIASNPVYEVPAE